MAGEDSRFSVQETTITDIHAAMRAGNLTAIELVNIYLDRIKKYDQPTKLNSLSVINPNAIKTAGKLDEEFQRTGKQEIQPGCFFELTDYFC